MSAELRRRLADPDMMRPTVDSMDTGAGGSHRQGGVFEHDHSHDRTPDVDEEEDGGCLRVEEDDEDFREADYAPPTSKRTYITLTILY